jgi:predicted DNA-binding ribbon-helix-helix protein
MRNKLPQYPWSFSEDQSPYCRNVTVDGRRTSVRMEPMIWQSLAEIAETESYTINHLCTMVDQRRGPMGLTAAIRLFVLHYYRLAIATADADRNQTAADTAPAQPPGFSDPGTTELVPGPASVDQALAIFVWTDEALARVGGANPASGQQGEQRV